MTKPWAFWAASASCGTKSSSATGMLSGVADGMAYIAVLVLFVGHFVGLLTPIAVWDGLGVGHGAGGVH